MPVPDKDAVLAALDRIVDPAGGRGLVAAGLVRGLTLKEGRAGFMLEVPAGTAARYAAVRTEAEAALKRVPGVATAQVVLTEDVGAPPAAKAPSGARLSDAATDQTKGRPAPVPTGRPEHVLRVVAVASGKGGVGKSTVAVNLACALAARGLSVGLLDADVYGPSAPTMLGLGGAPEYRDGKMEPKRAHGLAAMSVGLLIDADKALVWRGPMASQALSQMLGETRWGTADAPLDVLVVDLPPGTGDVQLTLVQKTLLDGAVIVSTPQEVALADARRAVAMFGKTKTPVLGLVENMSGFPHPVTGELIPIFGLGGAKAEAERLGVPFLGDVPIDLELRAGADEGRPLVATNPESAAARAFAAIAGQVAAALPSDRTPV